MASVSFRPDMEPMLEWILLLSIAASGLCFFGLAVMVILSV